MSNEPTTSFSASGEDAITRIIDAKPDESADLLPPKEFDEFYEIERTAEEIVKGDYRRIALQFPDELLHDSVPIFRRLKRKIGTGREIYVLADTSYGSCCVDEVAASHVDADAMVHYGHACMSQTSRLPVIYVFGKKQLDIDVCVEQFSSVFEPTDDSSAILLKHDVVYTHQAESLVEKLRSRFPGLTVLHHAMPTKSDPAPAQSYLTSSDSVALKNTAIFYVGSESLGLTNLLITNSSCPVYSFDPQIQTARLESGRTNRLLMRRYAVVQKARDADVFGILVGTLGVASYLPLIKHIRALLARKQKKSYTISVGKLNPAKLANFLEIECFVLVACPENSLIEAKEFLRPIITPYELEIALQAEQSWTGRYVLDFGKILANDSSEADKANGHQENGKEDDSDDSDQPVFSLITGTYRHAKRYGPGRETTPVETGSSAVVLRNQDSTVARLDDSAAGQFLQQRTYRGLEVRMNEDAPSVLEQGRSGIARGYQDDKSRQNGSGECGKDGIDAVGRNRLEQN
ncbi:unnamed protein product [Cyclocybe aegerita]|uniref:2-(3-amino-3-carboxypropyl)histidine synthase subunit 2 n=1 Tax=Cyclocybe aegerita TaxID=1973307 RepID=A0A8S0XRB1_CYCAE|nr:unnamed protein product [Cyclocybe aegerita]